MLLLILFVVIGFGSLKFWFDTEGKFSITILLYHPLGTLFHLGVTCFSIEDDRGRLYSYEVGLMWISIVFSRYQKFS